MKSASVVLRIMKMNHQIGNHVKDLQVHQTVHLVF